MTVSVWFDSTGAAIVEVMEKGQGQAEDAMVSGLAARGSRSRSPRMKQPPHPISIGYPPFLFPTIKAQVHAHDRNMFLHRTLAPDG